MVPSGAGANSNAIRDVIIVGAGPVGLLTALLLKQRGVDVLIVERQAALYPLPRAVCVDAEAERTLRSAGLASALETLLERITVRHLDLLSKEPAERSRCAGTARGVFCVA
jgi:3-(3-hydroxy-phenyl)propionate hydroxylase